MNSEWASINGFNGPLRPSVDTSQRHQLTPARSAIGAATSVTAARRRLSSGSSSTGSFGARRDPYARSFVCEVVNPARLATPRFVGMDMLAYHVPAMRSDLMSVRMAKEEREIGQRCCTLL